MLSTMNSHNAREHVALMNSQHIDFHPRKVIFHVYVPQRKSESDIIT